MVILIEFIALVFFLIRTGKNIKQIVFINKSSILWGLSFGILYSLTIFFAKHTHFGSSVIGQFVGGIKLQYSALYVIYPFTIAFSEEFIFRYIFVKKMGVLPAALIFTVLHWRPNFPIPFFIPIFLFGLFQSWLFNKTKSIWSPILSHLIATYSLLLF
jgi:membrane protease YdiL (CAAX protease family)